MHSFGTMINSARSELSRSPMIWWNLLASFLFLVTLVLSANILLLPFEMPLIPCRGPWPRLMEGADEYPK